MQALVKMCCDEIATPDDISNARNQIISTISKGESTLLELVESSGDFLTSTDHGIRNRGTRLLSDVLCSVASLPMPLAQLRSLLLFFTDRMKDEPCVREVLRGSNALLMKYGGLIPESASDACAQSSAALISALLQHVSVQSLALSDRRNAFEMLRWATSNPQLLGDETRATFAKGLAHCMDGERDPRNLLLCFGMVPAALAGFASTQEQADALFAATSCYFPITFTPPPNDSVGISSQMLRDGLATALSAHPLIATPAVDLALGKLAAAAAPSARLDAMDLIAAVASRLGVAAGLGLATRQVWSALRLQMVDASEDQVLLARRRSATHPAALAPHSRSLVEGYGRGAAR